MSLHQTKNDLSASVRECIVGLLDARLVEALDLSLQAKQAHWNVRGPHFAQLHALFDGVYEAAGGWADELAERLVQLGGTAHGTKELLVHSALPVYPVGARSSTEHLEAVSSALSAFGRATRAAIASSADAGDAVSSDLFTSITSEVDKQLWFVEAHLSA